LNGFEGALGASGVGLEGDEGVGRVFVLDLAGLGRGIFLVRFVGTRSSSSSSCSGTGVGLAGDEDLGGKSDLDLDLDDLGREVFLMSFVRTRSSSSSSSSCSGTDSSSSLTTKSSSVAFPRFF